MSKTSVGLALRDAGSHARGVLGFSGQCHCGEMPGALLLPSFRVQFAPPGLFTPPPTPFSCGLCT